MIPDIIVRFLLCIFLLFCMSANADTGRITDTVNIKKILVITSNQHTYGKTSLNTANHFEEIVVAYDLFTKQGYVVDFVSPDGGAIPLGYIQTSSQTQKDHLYNAQFMALLKNTFKPGQVDARDYQAVYYSGGGAAMFGVADNKDLQAIALQVYDNGGVVSAVCHGTAGIVNLKGRDGTAIFKNRKITGYPDLFEDTKAEYYKTFPFSIDKEISKNGGNFIYSKEWGSSFYVTDGRIITGQDPTSTAAVAREVIKAIEGAGNSAPVSTPTFDQVFNEFQAANKPAVAVALIRKGQVIYEKSFGNVNLEYKVPATTETRFQVDALGWEFLAHAMFTLAAQGKLTLQDDIRKYVTELPDFGEKISVNHLLSSTDGLHGVKVLNALAGWNIEAPTQSQGAMELIKRQKTLNFKPGTAFSPGGDTRLIILAKIVERASGQPLNVYFKENIFGPMGMSNTSFVDDHANPPENTAVPYRKESDGSYKIDHGRPGAASLYTSIKDLARWRLALAAGAPGQPAMAQQLDAPITLDNGVVIKDISSISMYGQQHAGKERGMPKIYQMGTAGGYASSMFRFPGPDVTVIVLSSGLTYNGSYGMQLASQLLESEFPEPKTIDYDKIPAVKLTATQLQAYTGNYWSAERALAANVAVKDGVLTYQRKGSANSRVLIPRGDAVFQMKIEGDDEYLVKFVRHGDRYALHFNMAGSDPIVFEPYQEVAYANQDLDQFTGTFYSEALDSSFVLRKNEGTLIASNIRAGTVNFRPLQADRFYGDKTFMGGIRFQRDGGNQVTGFEVVVDEVRNLAFRKIDARASR